VASGGGTVFFPADRYKTDERNLYVDDVSRGSIKTRFVGAGMFLSQIFTTRRIYSDFNNFEVWPEPRNHSTGLLSMYNVSDIEVCHLGFKGAFPAPEPDEDWNKKWEEFAKPGSVYASLRAYNQKGIATGSTNHGKDTLWYIDRPYLKNIEVHHCYFEAIESEACYQGCSVLTGARPHTEGRDRDGGHCHRSPS
jgi:hypothetical protein